MKTIGLIGGMSWESSLEYYRILNDLVKEKLGGLHSAQCIMYSVDFGPVEEWMRAGEWDKIAVHLTEISVKLEQAGADFILICTNTMHKVAEAVKAALAATAAEAEALPADEVPENAAANDTEEGRKAAVEGTPKAPVSDAKPSSDEEEV